MIEAVPTVMVRVGADANRRVREARRSNAPTEDAEGRDTHDRGTVGNQTAAAFPDKPGQRHVYPHCYKDDSTEVLVADEAFFSVFAGYRTGYLVSRAGGRISACFKIPNVDIARLE
jgi:hypothetical protein